jgi:hypothetical protein
MKKKDLLIPLAMLALGAGIGFWTRDRQQPQSGDAAATVPGVVTRAAEKAEGAGPASATPTSTSPTGTATPLARAPANGAAANMALPPIDAPVVDTIAALRARALAGDAVAACRLAADLMLCDWWQPSLDPNTVDRMDPDKAKSSADLSALEWQLNIMSAGELRKRRCAGVTDADLRESGRWLRAAARAGHVPSMRTYAETGGVPFEKMLSRLDELAIYREEAATMIESAARGGSVSAVLTLAIAYDSDDSPRPMLGEVLAARRDPIEAFSYRLLYALAAESKDDSKVQSPEQRVAHYRDDALKRGKLSQAQIDAAEQRARERFDAWFQGRRSPVNSMDMMPMTWNAEAARPINEVCTDGPWTTPPSLPARSTP